MELIRNIVNRWAPSDGALTVAVDAAQAKVSNAKGFSNDYAAVDGYVTVPFIDAKGLMPELGAWNVIVSTESSDSLYQIERVGGRYTDRQAIIEYGTDGNDEFDRPKYTDSKFARAVLAAEEMIESCCGRSFCERKLEARLWPGKLTELPVVDVRAVECDADVELVSYCQVTGIEQPTTAVITYGAAIDAQISTAATKLAASYLRPRAMAENARGTAMDGVFVSYELATGAEGSWTGIPYVDSVIEQHRSRRVMIG